jgi:radical SAM superfamily enzyme YgiQ (UPF0313 family)
LIQPSSADLHFGLSPFFRTEPLGLEYIAAALVRAGHCVQLADMSFERRKLAKIVRQFQPEIAGIACLHILDVASTLRAAQEIKSIDPGVFVATGGHSVAAYPKAMEDASGIDAICLGEGESVMAALCEAVAQRRSLAQVPSLLLPDGTGKFAPTQGEREWLDLSQVAIPDRVAVNRYRKNYVCLNYMPVWTMETTRGCPHTCKFCSVWQFYKGSCRFHAPQNVRRDFEQTGENVFVIDDFFWGDAAKSEELAKELLASRERKNWLLVQSRVDLVAGNPELLELWRPLARNFDIFFGFESPTRKGLDSLHKGTDVSKIVEAIRVAREYGFGITGNFIIDPEFTEEDFVELWEFVALNQIPRVGFTILTPLPGTHFFRQSEPRLRVKDWNQFDLHHLLWEPRLPVERFFELYCETRRRTVLNTAGNKKWWQWMRQVSPRNIVQMARILARVQKLMNPQEYLAEYRVPRQE